MSDVATAQTRDFGVALSGGGVRASAFALGSLLYLVDSGLNKRVSVISSVSGASLTNGFVLSAVKDFSNTDSQSFDIAARELIRRLLLKPVMGPAILALNVLLLLAGGGVVMISLLGWPILLTPWLRVVLPFIWGMLFLLRGIPIEFLIRKRYLHNHSNPSHVLSLGQSRPVGATTHVFCSTDFVTQCPFFFVDYDGVACTYGAFGWALASDLSIATAVRASAAMPGAFPPRALSTAQLRFVDPTYAGVSKPRWFHLADGGVWDNLGTQWFNSRSGPDSSEWDDVTKYLPVAPKRAPPGYQGIRNLLIMDARGWGPGFSVRSVGWRSILFRIPLVAEFLSLAGTSSILYENTVEPRVQAHMDSLRARMAQGPCSSNATLVSVGTLTDYPFERAGTEAWNVIPKNVRDALYDEDDYTRWMDHPSVLQLPSHLQALVDLSAKIGFTQRSLAVHVPEWLAKHHPDEPPEIGNLWIRSSDIGTKLSALSRSEVIALLIHGYIQAMGAASALIATERGRPGSLPLEFPAFERFEGLLTQRTTRSPH